MGIIQTITGNKQYSRYNFYLCEIRDENSCFIKNTLLYYSRNIVDGFFLIDPVTEEKYVYNHIGNYYYIPENDNYVHTFIKKLGKSDFDTDQIYFSSNDVKKLNNFFCTNKE